MVATEGSGVSGYEGENLRGKIWPEWHATLIPYANGNHWKAVWQLANTLIPYVCLWYLMIRSIQLGYPYALTLAFALLAAAFLVRTFILFHDCVHNSLFPSKGANTFFGYLCGMLVFTSFEAWRFSHLRHHAAYANLDARGDGDIWTLTLTEYMNLPRRMQLLYKLYRNPIVLLGFGALFNFLLSNRLPTRKIRRKELMSNLFTNLLIVALILVAVRVIGWRTYLLIL